MTRKTKAADLPEFDPSRYLEDDAAIAEYLSLILAENDPELLAVALGDIAKARGMTEIAKSTGLAREALYKALRPGAKPRFDTVSRVCAALGVRLVAEPAAPTYTPRRRERPR
ncbi:MAG: addiction module antidote protein [Gammaproteobacteria bacterium]